MTEGPEFAAADFDPASLPGLLAKQGAVLLRGALPPAAVSGWLPAFERAFAAFDALYQSGQMDAQSQNNLYRYGHVNPMHIEGFRQWVDLHLQDAALRAMLHAYFGPRAHLLVNNCAPRRQGPQHAEKAIFFHQDQEFMGPMSRALNLWTPLTPAGGEWPGLELWLGSPQYPLLNFAQPPAEREAICARIPAERLWRPVLAPGDLLIFTCYTVHRTWLEPGMGQTRISSELRLISSDDLWLTRSALIVCELTKSI